MKWYDKQKKLFEDKVNKPEMTDEDEKLDELTSSILSAKEETTTGLRFDDVIGNEIDGLSKDTVMASYDEPAKERIILDTTINKGTKFQGDVETEGNLIVYGVIVGNVNCYEKLDVNGNIEGDIICDMGEFSDSSIKGDVICKETLIILGDTKVEGNISASSMDVSGTIIGNIRINGSLRLLEKARIEGNIEANYIEAQKGAVIKGSCMITPNAQS